MTASGNEHGRGLELAPDRLRRRIEPATLPFDTTADVEPSDRTIGQPRAVEALRFGLEIGQAGFNVYVAGLSGSGRTAAARVEAERVAAERPVPPDLVYVTDFERPDRPRAIQLPAGRGSELARDMERFIGAASEELPRALESERFERRGREELEELERRREEATALLREFARERGFAIELTPNGIVSAPLADGRPLSPPELQTLDPDERRTLEQRGSEVQERAASTMRELRGLEREAGERSRRMAQQFADEVVAHRFEELRDRYRDQLEVLEFLDGVRDDIPGHLGDFRPEQGEHETSAGAEAVLAGARRAEHLDRYRVNVAVDNAGAGGAPVVFERNPSYYNLLGRIDYRPRLGSMVTGLHEIKAGAVQRANGGFLILDALELLQSPFAWQGLKRALESGEARIENLAEQLSPVPAATIRPEPVEAAVKVILIGPPLLHQLLHRNEPGFRHLFKVKADFATDMDWDEDRVGSLAAFVARCVRASGGRHLDRAAVAAVIEHAGRIVGDNEKLTTRLHEVSDIVAEAGHWAGEAEREVVGADHVRRAVEQRRYRSNLSEERVQEAIRDGLIAIDVDGSRRAQLNGLAVLELGDLRFARPARVTARVSIGTGDVISIEREAELSGPIHSKGFLALSGYLGEQYAQEWPLALRATITFEQSYAETEGDSASSAELYALLSAISGLPLRQGIAVTGSINQHGDVQAVGGVTEKVEGFYAACEARGLSGDQGVIVPRSNARNLMLREEIVAAVRERRFAIWAVESVDEGIELLTGRPAGVRQADGRFPDGSVHRLVFDRLRGYADRVRAFGAVDGRGGATSSTARRSAAR